MNKERIQKVMAARGVCSRRAAEAMIAAGRVRVNGRPALLGGGMDPEKDVLSIDGVTLTAPKRTKKRYIMLNKPRGYITTAKDERGRRAVTDLLLGVEERVYPVGRLDKDSEGLLLFTNDGEFANMITHPSGMVSKLYRVTVRPRATEEQLAALAAGVTLDGGESTLPASVRVTVEDAARSVLEISVRQGKNRQIRRMCSAVGLQVARLRRLAVGPLRLGMLQPGCFRDLTPAEVAALRGSAKKSEQANKGGL